jgi:zinc/manganese transport system substrate-binding protein
MKYVVLIAVLMMPLAAQAELNVFACEPEWAALAQEIGGDLVKTSSATNALQDPHYIQARPSLISKIGRADLVVCSGAELEIGWLPMLLRKGNNPDVLPGSSGFLEASQFVKRLDIAGNADRSQGDVHPQGNPHIQTNPHNIRLVAKVMSERLSQLDRDNTAAYQQRLEDFSQRWNTAIENWEKRAATLKGKRIITHHKSWLYLEDWLKLDRVATLEAIPGIPPTATHLGDLVKRFEGSTDTAFIIRAPFHSEKPSKWLSARTGIPAVMLPLTVGGTKESADLFKWFDDILNRLMDAEIQGN